MTDPHHQLGDLVDPVSSWNPSRDDPAGDLVYIDIASVDRESKTVLVPEPIACAEAPSRARQLLSAGDVLVSTVRPGLNAVAEVPDQLGGATASTGFTVLRPRSDVLLSRFLYHFVRTPQFVAELERFATGASYPAVTDAIVKGVKVPLPPLTKQRRIAAILDEADALRRKRREALGLLDDLLRSAFLEMFGDPVTNPRGWRSVEVGDVADVQGGLQVTAQRSEPLEIPYLRVANVYRDRLDLGEVKTIRVTPAERDRVRLCEGDVLVVEGHGNADEVGRAAVWDRPGLMLHQNHLIRVRARDGKLAPRYLSAFLNSPGGRRQMLRAGKTTSGLNTISTGNVKSTQILVPPLDLQRRWSNLVRATTKERDLMALDASDVDALFDSLRQRAFAGELRSYNAT